MKYKNVPLLQDNQCQTSETTQLRHYVIHVIHGHTVPAASNLPSRLQIGGAGRTGNASRYFPSNIHLTRKHDSREVVTPLPNSIAGGSLAQDYFSTACAPRVTLLSEV